MQVHISIHNVSFGGALSPICSTEIDVHTQRPKCVHSMYDGMDPGSIDASSSSYIINGRQASLQLFDVPYRDVKIPIACFCDNTSSLYNSPATIRSNSRTMELIFSVNKLNISEDFADIYFYASYEFVAEPDCSKRTRLRGGGGKEFMQYVPPQGGKGQTVASPCNEHAWYVEAREMYRSLFVMTWGYVMPAEQTMDDILRCNSKNRLLIYAGRPLKVVKIICPTSATTPSTALYIYSDDWLNMKPQSR